MFNIFSLPNDPQTAAFLSSASIYRSSIMCSVLGHAKRRQSCQVCPSIAFVHSAPSQSRVYFVAIAFEIWHIDQEFSLSNYCTYISCCWACQVTFDGKMILYPTTELLRLTGVDSVHLTWPERCFCIMANATECHNIGLGKVEAMEISPKR